MVNATWLQIKYRNGNENTKKMKINVKTLEGTHFVMEVNPQDTVMLFFHFFFSNFLAVSLFRYSILRLLM
ncbi:hypothetical protein ACSQ67_023422 [Phaseolus vulgaris]